MAPKKDNQEANPAMLNGMDPVIVNFPVFEVRVIVAALPAFRSRLVSVNRHITLHEIPVKV